MIRIVLFIGVFLISVSCSSTKDEERMINSQKLSKLISQKDKSLVYIWTTWCSGCRETLANTLPKLQQELDTSQFQIILIAASKNRQEVDSLMANSGLKESSYMLQFIGLDKGKFQTIGINSFLSSNFIKTKIYDGGIPVFFLVDRNGKVLNKKLPHSYDELMEALPNK